MPSNVPQFRVPKANPAQTRPFLWLFTIAVPGPPASALRLTSNNQDVTYGTSSDGTPLVYRSAPIALSNFTQRSDGSVPKFTVTIANVGGDLLRVMDSNDYLKGQPVEIKLVHVDALDDPSAHEAFPGEISNSAITEQAATIELAAPDLYGLTVPGVVLQPFACWKGYGTDLCGFDIAAIDPDLTILGPCSKSLDACRLRGDEEESAGRARLHPKRWGGMPGMEQA